MGMFFSYLLNFVKVNYDKYLHVSEFMALYSVYCKKTNNKNHVATAHTPGL